MFGRRRRPETGWLRCVDPTGTRVALIPRGQDWREGLPEGWRLLDDRSDLIHPFGPSDPAVTVLAASGTRRLRWSLGRQQGRK